VSITRVFRIEHKGQRRYAVGSGTAYRLLDGDILAGDDGLSSLTHRVEAAAKSGEEIAPSRFLPPVSPSKVVAIGLNYRDHAAEMNKPLPAEPLMFLKPSTAVIGHGDAIRLPPGAGRVDHEAELGVVIGRRASRVSASNALQCVLGLTCLNDVTARDLQRKDVQYTRGKGFDTFAPIGPCIAMGLDPAALDIEGWVNGEKRQASNTSQLIFSVAEIIAFVSGVMTLLPGDVIATGTPSGVGPLQVGDRVTVKIEGVGELSNPVAGEQHSTS
jgi:2-keto-4-pentenoate hydratase/2-oxohepta-3-ene-1,7-dioic acid hydratase in catechol pathway